MTKAVGFVLIVMASALTAYLSGRTLAQRSRLLGHFCEVLYRIRAEIEYYAPPMNTIVAGMARTDGPAAAFFSEVDQRLADDHERSFSEIFCDSLENSQTVFLLKKDERKSLAELASVLGRYDIENNISALARAAKLFEGYAAAAKQNCERASKIHMTIGFASGLALALLLL